MHRHIGHRQDDRAILEAGVVRGVELTDLLTGESATAAGRTIVNVTGSWVDTFLHDSGIETGQRLVGLVGVERTEDRRELAELLARGVLRPVLDTVYPLEDTAAAVEHIAAGRARGKVVVTP